MQPYTINASTPISPMKTLLNRITERFPRDFAWRLFLVASLPLNFWAMIVWFRNFGPIDAEYGTWDAIGLGAYLLTYAIIEIAVVYTFFLLVFMLLPHRVMLPRTFTSFSAIYYLVTLGIILLQSRAVIELPSIGKLWPMLRIVSRFFSSYYIIIFGFLALAVLAMLAGILFSPKVTAKVEAIMERLYLLAGIYLSFNLVAVIIILIRNL